MSAIRRRSSRRGLQNHADGQQPASAAVEESDEEGTSAQEPYRGGSLSDGEEERDDGPLRKRQKAANGKASLRESEDERRYPDGSIVRIRLKNFITYDSVEFYPGPNLNMIIGPNGTGKSSLVCAIALGLAGRPDALGRQKSLQDFVKDGKEKATIEIELKSRGRGGNVVVKRLFKRGKGNSSTWKINGEHSSEKTVREKMQSLSVQVDNLCSFLPQEKVSEFAQMDPPELLRETERAAGDSRLAEWHSQLIEFRDEEKKLNTSLAEERKHLENLEQRNAVLERDVARFRERETVLKNIRILEMKIPWCQYEQARLNYLDAKEDRQQKQRRYEAFQQRFAPIKQELERMQDTLQQLNADVRTLTGEYQEKTVSNQGLKGKSDKLQAAEGECDDLHRALAGIQRREKEKIKKLQTLRTDIANGQSALQKMEQELINLGLLEEEGGSQEPRGELAQLQREIDIKNGSLRDIAERVNRILQEQRDVSEEAARYRQERERTYKELQGLDDVRNQKLEILKRDERHCYEATTWLKDNMHLFQEKVYEPICLEISAKDPRYAQALEAAIQRSTMTTFVTQTREDYILLTEELITKRKLRINAVMFSHRTLESWKPEVPKEEIQSLGFDGYLLDYLDGPPQVLSALCQLSKIHAIPVTLSELRNNAEIERERRMHAYISKNIYYMIRRAYGSVSIKATRMKGSRYLTRSVDMERKQQLEEGLEQLHTNIEACAQRLKTMGIEEGKLRTKDQHVRQEKGELTERKRAIQHQKMKYDKLKRDIGIKQMQLSNFEKEETSTEMEDLEIKTKLRAVNVKRAKLALDFQKIKRQAVDIFYQRTLAMVRQIELQAKINERENLMRDSDNELAAAKAELQIAQETFLVLKDTAKRLLEKAKAAIEDVTDEEKADFQAMYTDKSLEDLEGLLMEQQARAEMINQTDAGVIDEYERRDAEIERVRNKLATHEGKLSDWQGRIQRIKDKWVADLSELVGRISRNFARAFDKIGCAGEVKLSQHEDYDKWGIDILVKFRDNEKLNLLTGQRQSGGERSVSTILYLMALQELSHTPFRVVDEINQGMDPRNERMVHGEMVRAACQEGTSQYFLITPKLLPDLDYHERMRVLCVFNGPYTPETIDAKTYLARRIARSG
ncbi:DNA repair ATPase SMC5 [Spizellomyces punctatus DAOM BR117]|uniref:Structural maintenance of chromosomes protein 5 n=1 Tax=Spizellomyces punctatus (strain DAOM BR117) TaxID=645134 RepID=A0A0L0H945_SPIPD|nr:DNA repair ATPase SMC5 [Spizellomyces punctatus DAOM BR117]KNC97459.1 hypothetical protein SPPG_07377 [Spizellomyces punctatus DAOM BR117]|eukprot:XP_016605499.1 hypothetical protein SPPG_07377 [Spizellomyces punctatus DAOM BR117]